MAINTIDWKNVSSTQVNGLLIQELPPITVPPIRYTETVVDGRDGSIIEELGYSAYDKNIKIGVYGNYNIDTIANYFRGEGKLILSNESGKYYNAKIVSQIDYNRLGRFRTATVKFRVQPYKFSTSEGTTTITSATTITNNGNVNALPLITITGSGTIEYKQRGTTIFSYTFPANETTVIVDCEKQECYYTDETNLRNRNMVGEFPELPVGGTRISWSGSVTQIRITKKSRWI